MPHTSLPKPAGCGGGAVPSDVTRTPLTLQANPSSRTGISDTVAVDIAGIYRHQGEGFGRNLTLDKDVTLSNEQAFRTKWLIKPNEDTDIRLSADYFDVESSIGVSK